MNIYYCDRCKNQIGEKPEHEISVHESLLILSIRPALEDGRFNKLNHLCLPCAVVVIEDEISRRSGVKV
jgi:hypothetical protein